MITKIARSLSHYYIQVTTTTLKCNIYQIFLISLIKSTASTITHVVNIITIGKNDGWYVQKTKTYSTRTVNISFASGMALKSVSHSRLPGLKREDKYDSYDMGHMGLLRTGMFYMHLQIVIHIDFMFFIFVYNVLYLG